MMSDQDEEKELNVRADAGKDEPKEEPVAAPRTGDPVEDGDIAPPGDAVAEPLVASEQPETVAPEAEQPETVAPEAEQPVSNADLERILAAVPQPDWVGLDADIDKPFAPERWPQDMEPSSEYVADEPRRPQDIDLDETPEAGTGIAVMHDVVVGRIPSNRYNICRRWQLTGVDTAVTPIWREVNLWIATAQAIGVPCPVFGTVIGLIVNVDGIAAEHQAAHVDFYVYNRATASATDSPQIDNRHPNTPTTSSGYGVAWGDGLVVKYGDTLELWCRCTTGERAISFEVEATFIIQQQCAYVVTGNAVTDTGGSPNGVYVLNGIYNGRPTFERIDGAYWLWYDGPSDPWRISTAKGSANYWYQTADNPVGSYVDYGTYTGTATVAAQAD